MCVSVCGTFMTRQFIVDCKSRSLVNIFEHIIYMITFQLDANFLASFI